MKMKKILKYALVAAALVSCHKLEYPPQDSSCTLNSMKCLVYYDADNLRKYSELDVLGGGTYNESLGAVSYTFPSDASMYNSETLRRCRLELTVPATARVAEVDAAGNETGSGISGMRDLNSTTVYFKVIAADGTEKQYQARFRVN